MEEGKLTYADVEEYEKLFTMAPSLLLKRFARKNTNLALKFKPLLQGYMDSLTPEQKSKLNVILSSDVDDLQMVMREAYRIRGLRQYKILADPKYKNFIVTNLDVIRSMI